MHEGQVVAVPVRDHLWDFTDPLIRHLLHREWVDRILIYDNGSTDDTARELARIASFHPSVRRIDAAGWPFYAMWGDAIRRAATTGRILHMLNNDIALAPGSLQVLADVLHADPNLWAVSPNPERSAAAGIDREAGIVEVGGSYRLGGLIGWCFTLAAQHWRDIPEPIPTDYSWWYGEDHLFATITERGGRLARVLGVGCDHVGEGTANDGNHEWTHLAKIRDHDTFHARWPNHP